MGPFPDSSRSNKHILAYIDNFTKYVVLRVVRDVGAKTTCKCIEEIIRRFGAPTYFISDQGTAFTAKQFEEMCRENDVRHVKNATATPRANGQVERLNRIILTAVVTMTEREDRKDWYKHLRGIQWAINSLQNATTKRTSHELLFDYTPRNAIHNKLILALEEKKGDEALEERREQAVQLIGKAQVRQKLRFDGQRKKPTRYKQGDLVLVQREAMGLSKKLMPKFKGPYMVSFVLEHDKYVLVDVSGAERTQRSFQSVFAADRMKPWCFADDGNETDDHDSEEDDRAREEDDQPRDEEGEDVLQGQDGRLLGNLHLPSSTNNAPGNETPKVAWREVK